MGLIERIDARYETGESLQILLDDCRDELAKQAERVKALEGLVEFFYGQMYMTSPKMNGQHTYRFRSGGWPMTHCIGPTAEAAVEAAMKEIERDKQEQIELTAVLMDSPDPIRDQTNNDDL